MKVLSSKLALGAIVLSSTLLACGGQDDPGGRISIVLSSTAPVASAAGALTGGAVADMRDGEHDDGESACGGLQAASVTFSEIEARTIEGDLVDVSIDLPVTVDLLALVDGKEATLPAGALPPGTYDQLVLVIRQVEVTLANGTKVAITPPLGGWTAVVPVSPPVDVVEGATTTVPIEFRRERSFGCGAGKWMFRPEFECRRR